ncbi:MAG TPA: hypothetical protein VIL85_25815 [Thermomicrobiales bacterium]|jgi:hypothetical protein
MVTQNTVATEAWKCAECPQILGTIEGPLVTIRHQKRQVKAMLPCAQICDRCGALNFRPAPAVAPLDTTPIDKRTASPHGID